jgi:hypothetical protein
MSISLLERPVLLSAGEPRMLAALVLALDRKRSCGSRSPGSRALTAPSSTTGHSRPEGQCRRVHTQRPPSAGCSQTFALREKESRLRRHRRRSNDPLPDNMGSASQRGGGESRGWRRSRGRAMRRSRVPLLGVLWPQAGAGRDHRRTAVMDRIDDLAGIDALKINQRDAEVGMPELSLDDR